MFVQCNAMLSFVFLPITPSKFHTLQFAYSTFLHVCCYAFTNCINCVYSVTFIGGKQKVWFNFCRSKGPRKNKGESVSEY